MDQWGPQVLPALLADLLEQPAQQEKLGRPEIQVLREIAVHRVPPETRVRLEQQGKLVRQAIQEQREKQDLAAQRDPPVVQDQQVILVLLEQWETSDQQVRRDKQASPEKQDLLERRGEWEIPVRWGPRERQVLRGSRAQMVRWVQLAPPEKRARPAPPEQPAMQGRQEQPVQREC